jgi:hypothetical protein
MDSNGVVGGLQSVFFGLLALYDCVLRLIDGSGVGVA